MAAWLDYVAQELRSGKVGAMRSYQPQGPRFGTTSGAGGYDPWEVSSPTAGVWGGRVPRAVRPPSGPTRQYQPAAFPERVDVSMPFSPPRGVTPAAPAGPPASTQGDLLGSIGNALGATIGNLNLANAIPWFMERVNALTASYADENAGSPLGAVARGAAVGSGVFLSAVEEASNAVAPFLEALPNWYRDTQLNDRAKFYQAIINGKTLDTGFLGLQLSGTLIPFTYGVAGEHHDYERWRDTLLHTVDPQGRMDAERRIAIIRDAVDLPESVKAAIRAKPNMSEDDLKALFDSAPEGRQWSYDPGFSGMLANFGYPLGFFIVEAKGGLGVAGKLRLGAGVTGADIAAAWAGGARGTAAAGAVLKGAGQVTTAAAQLQKYAMVSGVGTAGITTALDAVARYQGDEAAIRWFDQINRTHPISDNPRVQLVTGFTVNPFEAIGALRRGVLQIKAGGDVILGRSLGGKLASFHDSDELLYGTLAKMYRLSGPDEARAFSEQFYATRGEAFDEVVGLAADDVLDRLPHEERLAFIAANHVADDPTALTKAVLTTYGDEVWDRMTKHTDELAQRWHKHAWEYHQYPGAFSPEVAGLNARDFRLAKERTFDLRQRVNAVVGYTEYLRPEGQVMAREWLDRVATDGRVRVEGRDGLQDLIRMFPALRKYWQGLVNAGDTTIGREAVEEMLRRADLDYASAMKHNPARVRTGADPVLRPDSPRLELDYAEALGTDVDTIKAVSDWQGQGTPEQAAKLRDFLVEKGVAEREVADAMDQFAVWERASDYVETTTRPWVEAGERVVAAEKQVAALRSELARLHAIPKRTSAQNEALREAEGKLARLMTLVREAGDPLRPFSDEVGFVRSQARNADKVRRMNPDRLSAEDTAFLRRYVFEDGEYAIADRLSGRELWEHAKAIADRSPVSVSSRDAILAERALRKVEAQERLRQLATLDEAAAALGADRIGPPWHTLLRRVEGNWRWKGPGPAMGKDLRQAVSTWFRARGDWQKASDIMVVGDEEAWAMIRDPNHAGVLESLGRGKRRVAMEALSAGAGRETLDEFADWAMQNGAVGSSDEFVERLAMSMEARDDLLSDLPANIGERNLRAQAAIDVPPEYVAEAEANLAGRSLVYDPEFDAIGHPQNIAELARILDNPDELGPALRNIVTSDPILMAGADKIARQKGITLMELLSDPATHRAALRTLIPEGFEPPVPGVRAETWLDDLVMAGDAEAIAARSAEIAAAGQAPRTPIQTTLASARRARPVHPSTDWRRRLTDADADLTAAPSAAVLEDPANRIGLDVLSILNHGVVGTKPATLRGTIALLREIENGGATRMGLGPSLQAEAQRVANAILSDGLKNARRRGIGPGVFGKGLDPAMMAEDDLELARALAGVLDETTGRLRAGLDGDVVRTADSTAANVEAGVLRGGTRESGGAIRESGAGDTSRRIDLTPEPVEPLRTVQGMGEARRPIGYDERVNGAAEPGFIYRGIRRDRFGDVVKDGVVPRAKYAEDEIGRPASYWSDDIREAGRYNDTLLRIRRDDAAVPRERMVNADQAAADSAYAEMKQTEHLVPGTVPPGRIEYLGADYKWHPVTDHAPRSAEAPQGPQPRRIDLTGVRLSYDPTDPLGTLQYGLKRRPKDAVVMELARVPGLAEEFVTGRFAPWSERVWTGWTRQLYNYVFGPLENGAVGGAVRQEFIDRAAKQGIDGELADAIWQDWRARARNSRDLEVRVDTKGRRQHLPADNPMYADVRNIPNRRMDAWAHEAVDKLLDERQRKGLLDPAYRDLAHTIDYSTMFREASSPVRRWLAGESVKIGRYQVPSAVPRPLGKVLGDAYGLAAHNSVVTTLYYWFRFALDIRYHAMNYFEAQILYAGRAGLRRGEIDTGMLGQTEGYLRRFDVDFADNTGYATSRSRFAWAYRTFLKEQPDALRKTVKGLQAEDPAHMAQALRELADVDPSLAQMVRDMGDTPDGWIKAVDTWHAKMLRTVDDAEGDMVIDQALAEEIRKTPAMAEVYSALSVANKDLWRNIRETFYGNPARSRAERFLNNYLLFWPLSYQVKAAKWLTRVMFDRVGGLQTNAGGAIMLDRMAQTHQQLLATDPEYRDWFERHDTLVFTAQMLLPITPSSMGVSLNPILRNIFFDRSKAVWEIGPVYTFNRVLRPGMGELVDMYPELRDVPGFSALYATLSGQDLSSRAPADR